MNHDGFALTNREKLSVDIFIIKLKNIDELIDTYKERLQEAVVREKQSIIPKLCISLLPVTQSVNPQSSKATVNIGLKAV